MTRNKVGRASRIGQLQTSGSTARQLEAADEELLKRLKATRFLSGSLGDLMNGAKFQEKSGAKAIFTLKPVEGAEGHYRIDVEEQTGIKDRKKRTGSRQNKPMPQITAEERFLWNANENRDILDILQKKIASSSPRASKKSSGRAPGEDAKRTMHAAIAA